MASLEMEFVDRQGHFNRFWISNVLIRENPREVSCLFLHDVAYLGLKSLLVPFKTGMVFLEFSNVCMCVSRNKLKYDDDTF